MAPQRYQHPTDKGWAWVVLVASMGSNVLSGALVYFVGVVHTGLLDMFQADTVTFVALTGAVNSALMTLSAPVASYVINRFGCRTCCVLGSVFCFIGYASSAFVTSVSQVFFTYGIIAGFGLGFVYSGTNITVGFYFNRLRGVAAGIANSFQAVGILTGPIVYQAIVDAYDTRGAFLLIGAITLHFCFFGMFFRPTIYEGKDTTIVVTEPDRELGHIEAKDPGTFHEEAVFTSQQRLTEEGTEPNTDSMDIRTPLLKQNGTGENMTEMQPASTVDDKTAVNYLTVLSAKDVPICRNVDDINSVSVVTNITDVNNCSCEKINEHESCNDNGPPLENNDANESTDGNKRTVKDIHDIESLPFNPVSTMPHGINDYVLNSTAEDFSQQHGCEEDSRSALLSSCNGTSCVSQGSEPCHPDGKGKSGIVWLRRFMSSPYVQILDKAFLLHCTALFVSNVHVAGVFLHLPEYVKLQGTGPIQRAELFLAMGTLSLLSKLACGFATSDPGIDPLILSVGLMGLNGIITCLFPLFVDTFMKQMLFSSLFGLYFGGLYALVTPILVRFVGVNRLAHAYGVSMFFLGMGYAAGPAVAGLMMLSGSFFDMGAACFLKSGNTVMEVLPDTDTNGCGESDTSPFI